MNTKNSIRKIAENLHRQHSLSLPVDISYLCNHLDISLEFLALEDDVSGMIVMGERTAAIIVNATHHPNRQRFTGAHELGHHFLHHQPGKEFVDRVRYRRSLKEPPSKPDIAEVEANYFAAELLMPRFEVERMIQKLGIYVFHDEEVAELAQYFGVSVHAMGIRLNSLGYMPDWAMV